MSRLRRQGFTLLEMMVYVAVLAIILDLSYGAFFQYDGSSRSLRRNTGDIERIMRAGERWRSDLRQAVAPPRLDKSAFGVSLIIPQAAGDVVYWLARDQVWRKAGTTTAVFLPAVKSSTMQPDARQQVVAWRWEVELGTPRKDVTVRPLFTFASVAPFRE